MWCLGLAVLVIAVPPARAVTAEPVVVDSSTPGIDSVMAELYRVISGPAGGRDWERFRALFLPEARLIPVSGAITRQEDPTPLSVDDYVTRAASLFARSGFFERETGAVTEVYGHIAHRFSSYEARSAPEGPVVMRGINSVQLFFDGARWQIVTILWDDERTAGAVPDRYRGGD